MKYQHKKSYIKPRANGCNIVSQKTHNTECDQQKYKFLNEDIDVTLLDVTERQELRTKNMHTH